MFEIIVLVVVIIFLIKQNSRISNLEELLKNKVSTIPTPITTSPVSPTTLTQEQVTPPPPQSPQIEVSSEEASGRLLGKIGIAAVLVGVAFFLKYAFDNNWIDATGRVMIGILFGVAFLVTGQLLRKNYLKYSDLLMGGGISILYLSVYSAQAFYHLINPFTAGLLMLCVTALAFVISIVNATMTLALVGIVGGFATPFLSGVQENNMMMLFGYLTLLNVGVLGLSFFKKWPNLVAVALVGTGINFVAWFASYYTEIVLAPTLFFAFLTFLIFIVASIVRAVTTGIKADQGDYFLLAADAMGFATIAYVLLQGKHEQVLAFGAVFVALIYMMVAYVANKFNPQDKALNIFLPGLAVTFLSIAVPLQFSGPWIAVAWIIESCMLYFIASIISNRGFQIMGAIVYVFGLLNFFSWYSNGRFGKIIEFVPIFNMTFAVLALATVVAYTISYMYTKYGSITEEIRDRGIMAFVIIANILTIFAFSIQITGYYEARGAELSAQYSKERQEIERYNTGYDDYGLQQGVSNRFYTESSRLKNQSNTFVSIFLALYAALLTGIGFANRYAGIRRLGLILFVITGLKVLVDVWSLGQLYRIISFIVFGMIALIASFAYAKYKDRLKVIISLALLLLSGLSFGITEAAFNLENWQYMRSVSTPASEGFTKIILPPDISRHSSDFNDIRIINQDGNEKPYLITRSIGTKGGVINAKILNETTLGGATQFITDGGEEGVVHSRIVISANNPNFQRQVSIYSSNTLLPINSPSWALITDKGYLFKFTDTVTGLSSSKDYIDFDANTSRYFKVVIGDGKEGVVDISGAILYGDTTLTSPVYTKTIPVSVYNNPTKRATEVTADLGSSGYLTHSINLSSSDRNYSRKVLIESSDDNVSWKYIGQNYISNISTKLFTGSSNLVLYPEQKARYIRVSIINDDNMPISVGNNVEIEGPVISAIFETKLNESYKLYYGNAEARKPVYDIGRISAYIEENSIPDISLGEEIRNSSYVTPPVEKVPFTESYPWVLNVLLVLVVIFLAFGIGMYLWNFKKSSDLV